MRVHFGAFILDSERRQLFRGTAEIHLSPKAFDLLKTLIENRPKVVSKSELHERLWPATFVSDSNLASLVAEIREALQDDPRTPQFVRTAHRFGYAFSGSATDVSSRIEVRKVPASFWLIKDDTEISLAEGENILGRDENVDIALDSPSISRRHARIRVSAREVVIEDLGSKNGTYLRGERITAPVELHDGDQIRVGAVLLTFCVASPMSETQTEIVQ